MSRDHHYSLNPTPLEGLRLESLQATRTLQDFPGALLESLIPLLGSDVSFCSSFSDRCHTLAITPVQVPPIRVEPGYFQQNPLIQNYIQTRDCSAYKISDFLTEQELSQRESLYERHLKICGLADQMAMVIPEASDASNNQFWYHSPKQYLSPHEGNPLTDATTLGHLAIGFYRTSRTFSDRDRTFLNLIRPHIVQAYRNAQAYTKLQQQLDLLSQAMDNLGSVILSLSGRIQFISPRALQLLSQYFPDFTWVGEHLPDNVYDWVREQIQQRSSLPTSVSEPFRVEQSGQLLTIRLLGHAAAGQFLLILEENRYQTLSVESLQFIGLTQRQSEVLFWIAQGKSDAEIAATLRIAKKTVAKHLENIYEKLSVHTRAEAVIKALELLRLME